MIMSSYNYKFVVICNVYGIGIPTSVLFLCDPTASRPHGACEVCRVGRCSVVEEKLSDYIRTRQMFVCIFRTVYK
jgi:hypothetical protein